MTLPALPARIPADAGRIAKLEEELERALAPLPEQRQKFVRLYSRIGDPVFAVVEAGYSAKGAKDQALRLRKSPEVAKALRLASELRDATVGLSKRDLIGLYESALEVRWSDYYLFDSDGKTPVELRPIETWSIPMQIRVKKLPTSKIHRSAKGERGGIVFFNDDWLVPAIEIADRITRLRGWEPDKRHRVDVTARPGPALRPPGSKSDAEQNAIEDFYDAFAEEAATPEEGDA